MRWSLCSEAAVCAAASFILCYGQQMQADLRKAATPTPAPASVLTAENRADIYMARKMYKDAAELYLTIQPPSAIVLNKAGIAYHQLSELTSAKRYYERALKIDKKYAEALNNLGAVYYSEKSYRRSVSYYKRALKLSPDAASMHSNLGTAYFARKKYKEAFDEYATALRLDPEVFERRSTQGTLLQERNVEERGKFNFYLAKSYAKANMPDRALLYMRKALETGFKERNKFLEDGDFASIRQLPEFTALMELEPRVL